MIFLCDFICVFVFLATKHKYALFLVCGMSSLEQKHQILFDETQISLSTWFDLMSKELKELHCYIAQRLKTQFEQQKQTLTNSSLLNFECDVQEKFIVYEENLKKLQHMQPNPSSKIPSLGFIQDSIPLVVQLFVKFEPSSFSGLFLPSACQPVDDYAQVLSEAQKAKVTKLTVLLEAEREKAKELALALECEREKVKKFHVKSEKLMIIPTLKPKECCLEEMPPIMTLSKSGVYVDTDQRNEKNQIRSISVSNSKPKDDHKIEQNQRASWIILSDVPLETDPNILIQHFKQWGVEIPFNSLHLVNQTGYVKCDSKSQRSMIVHCLCGTIFQDRVMYVTGIRQNGIKMILA